MSERKKECMAMAYLVHHNALVQFPMTSYTLTLTHLAFSNTAIRVRKFTYAQVTLENMSRNDFYPPPYNVVVFLTGYKQVCTYYNK